MTKGRLSRWVAVGAGLLIAALLGLSVRNVFRESGIPTGSALENSGGGGIVQPLPPDTPLSLGLVSIVNRGAHPVDLVDARLLRLDPDLELLGFSVLPTGPNDYGSNPPITWLEHPLKGSVALPDYPPIPPAPDGQEQAVVMFGLRVKPQGAGKAVGIEVTYRENGSLRRQVFEDQVYVCWVPQLKDADCPGPENSLDFFGDYEDEVKGISRYPPLPER